MTAPAVAPVLPLLVIEDEPSVMAFMCAALQRHGYTIVSAKSGVDGLKILAERDLLGVISDMRTPGGVSGADVHAWIVQNRPQLASRIVFITGDTVNNDTVKLLRETGAPCIEKPFRVSQLLSAVTRIFGTAS
jgi:DNA-binding NtrC family response regulator